MLNKKVSRQNIKIIKNKIKKTAVGNFWINWNLEEVDCSFHGLLENLYFSIFMN